MQELPKTFDPQTNEALVNPLWNHAFVAQSLSKKPPFSIVIPPPNVTGQLHMGHALDASVQDLLIRFHRMRGFNAVWYPGTDHAGIATQTVVERMLLSKENKRRTDMSKEEFLAYAFAWKDEYEQRILSQFKRLGSSCDWSRQRFTLDDVCSKTVNTMFKKLFDQGLIYRGLYLVNWDPVSETALADDEVEFEEQEGKLYTFQFQLSDKSGFIQVATTRPETMLADVAIAVHPKDEKYAHIHKKTFYHPLRKIDLPIVLDHFVEPEFGTGAVKITPGHDPNDYACAKRLGLEAINMMTANGCVIEGHGPFSGLKMADARQKIVEMMQNEGHLVKIEKHTHRVGISYRSKAVIEPFLSKQWFVNMRAFKDRLNSVVANKEVELIPQEWERTYHHWIDNLQDWCISRQLWWGHPIPIWYDKQNEERVICYSSEGLPPEVEKNPERYRKETDVLDTWFSSALWPLSCTKWVENDQDFKTFFPTSVLVTGHDILFFWVARMILMSEVAVKKPPFKKVFLHGLIYAKSYWREGPSGHIEYVSKEERRQFETADKLPKGVHFKWEKMSKSKGNVIDPVEMIDTYGVDAVRFTLLSLVSHARQIDLDLRRFEEGRNFINKIWNAFRFTLPHLEGLDHIPPLPKKSLSDIDQWILERLRQTSIEIESFIDRYYINEAAQRMYRFFWDDFCAVYLEATKPVLFKKRGTLEDFERTRAVLVYILLQSLEIMHPFIPFVTEEIYQHIRVRIQGLEPLLALKQTTQSKEIYDIRHVDEALDWVQKIRNVRAEMQIPLGAEIEVLVIRDQKRKNSPLDATQVMETLTKSSFEFVDSIDEKEFGTKMTFSSATLFIPLPKELLFKECVRIEKQIEAIEKKMAGLKSRLENREFVAKAPPSLLESTQDQYTSFFEERLHLKNQHEKLLNLTSK
ncbi:MAG: valine--tRNA ligase [Chlamydiae bacterium]|nr:valine--tRNA ligase [Chlamydiota bacterium]